MWILAILVLLAAAMGAGMIFTSAGRRELKEMTFPDIPFGRLRQGTYVGEYKGTKDSFRNTRVQVAVAEGKVTGITVLEGSTIKDGKAIEMRGGLSVDDLSGRVVNAQSLHVDVISGATLTCNAHLKAVEDALSKAQAQ